MDFTLMPQLKRRTLIKIATLLWSRSDIEDVVARFYTNVCKDHENLEKWQVAEDRVKEKVSKLPLPEPLKKEISGVIRPIGREILKWKEYHVQNCGRDLPVELCWTLHGTVSQKKTAEMLVKDESIDISTRYMLACVYCLESDVKELWNSMSQREKNDFYNDGPPKFKYGWLAVFWAYDIEGESTKLINWYKKLQLTYRELSPYQFAFEYAPVYGSKAAVEYFLQKLTPREKDESLVECADKIAERYLYCANGRIIYDGYPREQYADTLCYLLSEMREEQQIKVFESYPVGVLLCLLEWPCQNLFFETANHVWDFHVDYEILSRQIARKIIDCDRDYNYHKLFGEIWKRIPCIDRKYVMINWLFGHFLLYFLRYLFQFEGKEIISLLLKYVSVKGREKIIFDDEGKDICERLIYNNKWDLLKFFLQECISSQDSLTKFKEEFKKRIISRHSAQILKREKDLWTKFFQFLDDLINNDNKKRGRKENSSAAKRLKFN